MSKKVIMCTWDDAPHLSEQDKKEALAAIPEAFRDARSRGVPTIGSGNVYPVLESEIVCDPFSIPDHYPKGYGMDVGWNSTAAIWGALDRESDTLYLYSEYLQGKKEPVVHAKAIKSRGDWIKGAIDHAANASGQADGKKLFKLYKDEGLNLVNAEKQVEAGLLTVYDRLSTGRLKIFSTLNETLKEYRVYRRNEQGKIVKSCDHIMDSMRYLVMTLDKVAKTRPSSRIVSNTGTIIADSHAGY